jgi:YD repeat-containing protein
MERLQDYEYNANGRIIKLTDFGGGILEYKYNSIGKSGGITK